MNNNSGWYRGWRNIITIISFLLLIWPISVIIMWVLATWSKKTKLIITAIFLVLFASLVVPILFYPLYKSLDAFALVELFPQIGKYLWYGIFLAFGVGIVGSIILTIQKKTIGKLWAICGAIIALLFVIMFFSTMVLMTSISNTLK